jgi:hypothetical protein
MYPKDITLSWRLRPLGHLSVESIEVDETVALHQYHDA